jgi:hypothetical protein
MTTPVPARCADALRSFATGALDDAADSDVGGRAGRAADVRAARRHVERCPSCSALLDDAGSADAVLALLATRRPARSTRLRQVLGAVAVLQCTVALPWLFGTNPFGVFDSSGVASAHLTRDGAIGILIGVAGLTTALRPRHALAMLVTAGAAVGMQLIGFAVDERNEHVHPLFETSHLLVPVVLVLIATIGLRRDRPVAPPARSGRHLRAL